MLTLRSNEPVFESQRGPFGAYVVYLSVRDDAVMSAPKRVAVRTQIVVTTGAVELSDLLRCDVAQIEQTRPGLKLALSRLAVTLAEEALADGRASLASSPKELLIRVEGEMLPRLLDTLDLKRCSYQGSAGRDLVCRVPANEDAQAFELDGSRVGATTHYLCATCELPDDEYICSHLMHPRTVRSTSLQARSLVNSACAVGNKDPGVKCKPGRDCWVRLQADERTGEAAVVSSLAIHESVDFLSAVWRNVFGTRLRKVTNMVPVGTLGASCASREDFVDKMVALGDVLKCFDVPDSLLDPDVAKSIAKDQTLNRIEAAVQRRLKSLDQEQTDADAAVSRVATIKKRLRAVTTLRDALAHTNDKLPDAMRELGLPSTLPAWPRAWELVRSRVVDALNRLRNEVEGLAE